MSKHEVLLDINKSIKRIESLLKAQAPATTGAACMTPCAYLGGCQYHREYLCRAAAICVEHTPVSVSSEGVAGACMETCYNDECKQHDKNNKCFAFAVCFEIRRNAGYTIGDWDMDKDPIPCLRTCFNRKCADHREDDSCMAVEVCQSNALEDDPELEGALPPIACSVIDCSSYDSPGTCKVNFNKCPRRKTEADKLQGYTLEQWQAIIDGGYLCQVSPGPDMWDNHNVRRVFEIVGPEDCRRFKDEKGTLWTYCRPAQIPGVLRPWFGGECPVAMDVTVLVKFRKGEPGAFMYPDNLTWSHGGRRTDDIIAYMEV